MQAERDFSLAGVFAGVRQQVVEHGRYYLPVEIHEDILVDIEPELKILVGVGLGEYPSDAGYI